MNVKKSDVVDVVGPVVIPAPLPARTLLLVIVFADPAIATCAEVMPEIAEVVVEFPALLAVHEVHVPVRLVITPLEGVPRAGVVKEGETSGANVESELQLKDPLA